MSFQFSPLAPASLHRDVSGTPFSERYGDIYHSRQGAIEQARHIFLNGNGLPDRWRGRSSFTVCETGFGLGRNFLALWQAWRLDPQRSRRLHVVSFEAHPFAAKDMLEAARDLPSDLRILARQLAAAWPLLLPGVHRLEFDAGRVSLTLFFGRIEQMASEAQAAVDAFFLDGFAPQKNPEMWSRTLFGQLVRLGRPGATAATWCVNGEVRRALRDSGFIVSKAPGFGGKREMTQAVLRPGLGWAKETRRDGRVLIVGAGPAGAAAAHALALRGRESLVVDPAVTLGRGGSHRGHLAAALTPLISRDDDQRSRLSRAGVLRALGRWQSLPEAARPKRVGTIELLADVSQEALRRSTLQKLAFPKEWVEWLDADEVSRRVGIALNQPGTFFAHGQLVRPEPLLEALLGNPLTQCHAGRIANLQREGDGWVARSTAGESFEAAYVVLANSTEAASLLSTCFDLHKLPKLKSGWRLAGQVSHFQVSDAGLDPATILSAEGYFLPALLGVNVAGGTYVAEAAESRVTMQGHRAIAQQLAGILKKDTANVLQWLDKSGGWAGWRAVVGGRLPVIGQVHGLDDIWLSCAFGSRGLTWAPLAADLLAATLEGEPLPLERSLQRAVAPR